MCSAAELPGGFDQFAMVLVDLEVVDLLAAKQPPVEGAEGIGALGGVLGDVVRDLPRLPLRVLVKGVAVVRKYGADGELLAPAGPVVAGR